MKTINFSNKLKHWRLAAAWLYLYEKQNGTLSILLLALTSFFWLAVFIYPAHPCASGIYYLPYKSPSWTIAWFSVLPLQWFLYIKVEKAKKCSWAVNLVSTLCFMLYTAFQLCHGSLPPHQPSPQTIINLAFFAFLLIAVREALGGNRFYSRFFIVGAVIAGIFFVRRHLLLPEHIWAGLLYSRDPKALMGENISCGLNTHLLPLLASFGASLWEALSKSIHIHRTRQTAEAEKQYILNSMSTMQESMEQVRIMKHEMKNHLSVISAFLRQGEAEKAEAYLEKIYGQTDCFNLRTYTGNAVVDAILSGRLADAGKRGIRVEQLIKIPDVLPFSEYDLCSLLCNLLDNALEACDHLPSCLNRWLRITMHVKNYHLYLEVSNPVERAIAFNPLTRLPDTTKEDTCAHGYGLKTARRIAEKYSGIFSVSCRDNEGDGRIFSVKLTMCLKNRPHIEKNGQESATHP